MSDVSIDYASCYIEGLANEDEEIYYCCSTYATSETLFTTDYQECICLYITEAYGSDSYEYET